MFRFLGLYASVVDNIASEVVGSIMRIKETEMSGETAAEFLEQEQLSGDDFNRYMEEVMLEKYGNELNALREAKAKGVSPESIEIMRHGMGINKIDIE